MQNCWRRYMHVHGSQLVFSSTHTFFNSVFFHTTSNKFLVAFWEETWLTSQLTADKLLSKRCYIKLHGKFNESLQLTWCIVSLASVNFRMANCFEHVGRVWVSYAREEWSSRLYICLNQIKITEFHCRKSLHKLCFGYSQSGFSYDSSLAQASCL